MVKNLHKNVFRLITKDKNKNAWYDNSGNYSPTTESLAKIPMPHDPDHYRNGKIWHSSAKSIANLKEWFTKYDLIELHKKGYLIRELQVAEFFEKEKEILFTYEGIIKERPVSLDEIYPEILLNEASS
jgi:hypothetical protein